MILDLSMLESIEPKITTAEKGLRRLVSDTV
jgi:hypothetical protein